MKNTKHYLTGILLLAAFLAAAQHTKYPMDRPQRTVPAPAESSFEIYPSRNKQIIKGLGVEIYSDMLNNKSDGQNMPGRGIPHDLVPAERTRLYQEMLQGFRYARLAGGLYIRGMDSEKKQLQGRWPTQLAELKELIEVSKIEGASFEYWSPLPYWKANQKLTGKDGSDNVLRCFGRDFKNDPVYHGDTTRFLNDFAAAIVKDIQLLKSSGISVSIFGLQNEPNSDTEYSSCTYKNLPVENYGRTYVTVAKKVRELDPSILLIGDSQGLRLIKPVVSNPETRNLVDYMVMHHGGVDSKQVQPQPLFENKILFQNEYSYSGSGNATAARCLNTVQHMMNWFERRGAPSWFWLHALMPYNMGMSSGRALGLYRASDDLDDSKYPKELKPGHWMWNPYNWHALGSFTKRMPWDSQAVEVKEEKPDEDLRIFAFKRPNGKLTIVVSNRSFAAHTFKLNSGLKKDAVFKGYRYTPEQSGKDCKGIPLAALKGGSLSPKVPDMAWEFWEEQ